MVDEIWFISFVWKKKEFAMPHEVRMKRDWKMHKKNNSDLNENTQKVLIKMVWVGSVLVSSAHSDSELFFRIVLGTSEVATLFSGQSLYELCKTPPWKKRQKYFTIPQNMFNNLHGLPHSYSTLCGKKQPRAAVCVKVKGRKIRRQIFLLHVY